MSSYLNGTAFGCGTACNPCGKDQREACWVTKMCFMDLKDIGRASTTSFKRRERKKAY